jgi:hypothetical protein
VPVEDLHPLQWGIFRIKHRRDRRSGLPIENPIVFYARYAADVARKAAKLAVSWRALRRIVKKIEADPLAKSYTDAALTAVVDEDAEHMELYTQNEAARIAVERELRVAGGKPKGNGQPGPAARTNGSGKNGHAGNGHGGNRDDKAAGRAEIEERLPESAQPLA